MRKTRVSSAEPASPLIVVIPIDAHTCNSTIESCEEAWLLQVEDSECTEEEKVAVEQLTELRRIRYLSSMQEDETDCSCFTEGSFNTYEERLPPLLASSHTCNKGDPSTSPAASSPPTCIFDFRKLKDKQEQQKYKLKSQQNQDVQDNLEDDMIFDIQVATSEHVTPLSCCEWNCDDDECKKPRSRLLSDIYHDHSSISSFSQNSKANKKRCKGISNIM